MTRPTFPTLQAALAAQVHRGLARRIPGPTPAQMVSALARYTPAELARIEAADAGALADLRAYLRDEEKRAREEMSK